ncbi:VacJ family lipoprotein [Pseudogulbenkiania sp. MAI-1]|uniref:MlaA family lipoprotein n=1 Tax=Pseudogulbenkiania sp. MAI-1 TaxID=990370 RepID=UPI00045EA079|nr:VacJ family lipoprotein [Pseudogulbenkiania sp. MAI-1]
MRIAPLLLTVALAGCASTAQSQLDPLEPVNRAVYRFNDTADRAVLKPVAEGYRAVTPRPVRIAVGNFFDNIRDAYSAINNALRADAQKATNDVMRVAINSTFGLLGLIDIATPAGLANNKTTLGDTFASWGWKNSSYLVLPLLGPSTVRDGLGTAATLAANPEPGVVYQTHTQLTAASVLNAVNTRARLLGLEQTVDEAALDPYSYLRDAYLQLRAKQVGAELPKPSSEDEELDIDQLVAPPDASAPQ